jgi:FkbM family methyltransferase
MGLFQKIFGKEVRAVNNYELLPEELRKDVLNVSIAFNKYGAYCTPLSSQHRTLNQKILKGDVFEPETIKYMMERAGEGDMVQAGACFGDFLPALSKAIHKDGHIWAFEPNSENYRCAQITMVLNGITNVHLINSGLGAKSSKAEMLISDNKGRGLGGSSKIVESGNEKPGTELINIVALDEVIPQDRRISILQLDAEGYEEQALKGAIKLIARCRPVLILEDDHGVTKTQWFKENVLALGYQIAGKLHYNTLILPEEQQS